MAINIVGVSVTSEGEDEKEEVNMCSYCGLCNNTGFYMGQCCPACGGGT